MPEIQQTPEPDSLAYREARLKVEQHLLDGEQERINQERQCIVEARNKADALWVQLRACVAKARSQIATGATPAERERLEAQWTTFHNALIEEHRQVMWMGAEFNRALRRSIRFDAKAHRLQGKQDRLKAERVYLKLNSIRDSAGAAQSAKATADDLKGVLESIDRLFNHGVAKRPSHE